MSPPPSFGAQVAAIMDVLTKAAVAEITKLVEDGTVVLRLEMCRKDGEIQELKRSLKLMEIELCKAQEAAMTRAAEDKQERTTTGNQPPLKDEREDQQIWAVYLEPESADSPCEPRHRTERESHDMGPAVKHEPPDELAVQETTDDSAAAAANVSFEAGERDDPIWPPAACDMFEKSSVPMQQHLQIFPSHAEQFSAHQNTESSYNSAAAEEVAEDSLSVPIKQEIDIRPVCMGGAAAEPVHDEPFRRLSRPAVSQDQGVQAATQQAGPSLAGPSLAGPSLAGPSLAGPSLAGPSLAGPSLAGPSLAGPSLAGPSLAGPSLAGPLLARPHAQRSAADAEEHVVGRHGPRAKRLVVSVWRANQKLFISSVCNKGFPRLSQLEEHKATHQPVKPFRCLECGKSFTQKTRLKSHQSVHTGERPFSCKICGKMFSRQDNCLRHERFHSGLKPYSCGQCGKSFTMLGKLKIHQEIHLQGR